MVARIVPPVMLLHRSIDMLTGIWSFTCMSCGGRLWLTVYECAGPQVSGGLVATTAVTVSWRGAEDGLMPAGLGNWSKGAHGVAGAGRES